MEFVRPPSSSEDPALDYSLLGGEHVQRGRRLFSTGVTLLVGLLLWLAYTADVHTPLPLLQGLAIIVLSVLPALFWARTGGSRFPVFEVILLLCANAYGMPMVKAAEQLAGYSDEVIARAGWAVIIYLAAANLAYRATRGRPGNSGFWRESLLTERVEKTIVYGLIPSAAYAVVSTFTLGIPREIESVARAVFYGLGILCTFVSSQRLGRGELTRGETTVLVVCLVIQLIVMAVGLVLIASISMIGIALLGYLSGGKRIPWLVLIITFTALAVLHTGKTRMRTKYWEDLAPPPTVTQLPAFFSEWVAFGLQPTSGDKTAAQKMIERTSLMHMLCLIVAWSPDRQDYLYGSTYRHVLPQLVPRFLWSDKPRSHVATYELSIYYGLQAQEDTAVTTIAFGLLTEAYANFGLAGAVLLGIFWGYTLKKLQIWSAFSPMFSFAGLFMVLLTAWAFSAELTMAAWVSSLQQAVVVVLGVPFLIRSLLGR